MNVQLDSALNSSSQRDESIQPRVASHELPWVRTSIAFPNPERVVAAREDNGHAMKCCNPFRVVHTMMRNERWNPFGIPGVGSLN
jgi:hypothetical protein